MVHPKVLEGCGIDSTVYSGFAFGMGGLGAAVLGVLADHTSIIWVYKVISFLPLLGIVAAFLPSRRAVGH